MLMFDVLPVPIIEMIFSQAGFSPAKTAEILVEPHQRAMWSAGVQEFTRLDEHGSSVFETLEAAYTGLAAAWARFHAIQASKQATLARLSLEDDAAIHVRHLPHIVRALDARTTTVGDVQALVMRGACEGTLPAVLLGDVFDAVMALGPEDVDMLVVVLQQCGPV